MQMPEDPERMIPMPRLPVQSRRRFLAAVVAAAGGAILAACGDATTTTFTTVAPAIAPATVAATAAKPALPALPATNAATAAPAATSAPVAATPAGNSAIIGTTAASGSGSGAGLGSGMVLGQTWEQILAKAKGSTVNWFLYGASTTTNDYLNGYVIPEMAQQYGITVKPTPISDTVEAVNKVLAEKQAGKTTGGSVDMVWINGANFRTMSDADIVFTGWARALPNAKYIAWDAPVVANDFGVPVNAREAPWSFAQFVFVYDTARTKQPWKSMAALETYVKANPGTFTYIAPPDFTGSAFVRHVVYETTGGYQQYGGSFNEAVYAAKSPAAWDFLNRIKPYLWQKGETYPESAPKLDMLFANGEVNFTMSYSTTAASVGIAKGIFPRTTRTFYLDAGTVANVSYVTIPFNAANKEGALVLADFLDSPAAQTRRAIVAKSGDATVLNLDALSDADKTALKAIPLDEATLPYAELSMHAVPELPSAYVTRIDKDWAANVLKK